VRLPLPHLAVVVVAVLAVLVGGVLYPMWRQAVDRNRDVRADPYHIAGNLYFVGDTANTSFLLIGDEGDVLLGGGEPGSAHKIIDNIEQLGFDRKQVRTLLATSQNGGLAELQRTTGAEVWASDISAQVIESGGANNPRLVYTPYKLMSWAGILKYPAARVDHRVKDNETIHLGSLAVTAHVTPGDGFDCTTWTFMVRDRDRDFRVVHRCNLELPYSASLVEPEKPPGIRAGFEQTIAMLRNLPVDIWLTSQGREYGRFRKYQESLTSADPVAPFVDPNGYAESIDKAEAVFHRLLDEQEKQRQRH